MDAKPFDRAVSAAGGLQQLSDLLGYTPGRVGNWRRRGIPPVEVLRIVRAVKGRVSPYDIDRILYPDPDWMPPGVTHGVMWEESESNAGAAA